MNKNSFYLEIDTKALSHNIEYLRKIKNKNILPVIKANAYGHGYEIILEELLNNNIKNVAVARLSEASLILNFNTDIKILVFEDIEDLSIVKNNKNIIMEINSISKLKDAISYGIPTEQMSIKIDLGYARNGIKENEFQDLKNIILYNDFKFQGIHSHIFSSNYYDGLKNIKIFSDFIEECGRNKFECIHIQNTAATYNYDCEVVTHVRVGTAMYGIQEPGYYDRNLIRVGTFLGAVDSIKNIEDLKYIGYELKENLEFSFQAKKIAKIKIGYADGFIKRNENTYCLIKNKEYKILHITMDTSFVEIDDRVEVDDIVEIYHKPENLKDKVGLHIYELLTLISPIRIYRIKKGEIC